MWVLRIFLVMLIIVLVIGFSIYNSTERVSVRVLNLQYIDVPMIFVVYWAFVIGMFISFVLGLSYYLKISADLREQKREVKKLMQEITTLRNMPLEDVENV